MADKKKGKRERKKIERSLEEAQDWFNRGMVFDVYRILDPIIDSDPQNIRAHELRGQAYSYARNWDAAVSDFNTVIDAQPGNAFVYNQRAIVFRGSGRFDAALRDHDKAIELEPFNSSYKHARELTLTEQTFSEMLNPAHIERAFIRRAEQYEQKLNQKEKIIWLIRGGLFLLFLAGGFAGICIVGLLLLYLGGMTEGLYRNFNFLLVSAPLVLSLLLGVIVSPIVQALRAAGRDKRRLEIAIEDYFRKGVLMRNVVVGKAEQKPELIAATHEHLANRSMAEFLADWKPSKEERGFWREFLNRFRKPSDDSDDSKPS